MVAELVAPISRVPDSSPVAAVRTLMSRLQFGFCSRSYRQVGLLNLHWADNQGIDSPRSPVF
jgi:hypothetical protein